LTARHARSCPLGRDPRHRDTWPRPAEASVVLEGDLPNSGRCWLFPACSMRVDCDAVSVFALRGPEVAPRSASETPDSVPRRRALAVQREARCSRGTGSHDGEIRLRKTSRAPLAPSQRPARALRRGARGLACEPWRASRGSGDPRSLGSIRASRCTATRAPPRTSPASPTRTWRSASVTRATTLLLSSSHSHRTRRKRP